MKFETYIKSKIVDQEAIPSLGAFFQLRGDKVVFTNGCFDIVHVGHTYTLNTAADLGDKLVVGLNSDASVKRLKGDKRPIISQEHRLSLVASFVCVDYVILFEEDTPENLIQILKPDILVKGDDYRGKEIAGADFVKSYGGRVVLHELKEHFSTTHILHHLS